MGTLRLRSAQERAGRALTEYTSETGGLIAGQSASFVPRNTYRLRDRGSESDVSKILYVGVRQRSVSFHRGEYRVGVQRVLCAKCERVSSVARRARGARRTRTRLGPIVPLRGVRSPLSGDERTPHRTHSRHERARETETDSSSTSSWPHHTSVISADTH